MKVHNKQYRGGQILYNVIVLCLFFKKNNIIFKKMFAKYLSLTSTTAHDREVGPPTSFQVNQMNINIQPIIGKKDFKI